MTEPNDKGTMVQERWWSAHQVLAWVFNRNEDLVSKLSDHRPPNSNLPRYVSVAQDDKSISMERAIRLN